LRKSFHISLNLLHRKIKTFPRAIWGKSGRGEAASDCSKFLSQFFFLLLLSFLESHSIKARLVVKYKKKKQHTIFKIFFFFFLDFFFFFTVLIIYTRLKFIDLPIFVQTHMAHMQSAAIERAGWLWRECTLYILWKHSSII
jgi:hypothetical protein